MCWSWYLRELINKASEEKILRGLQFLMLKNLKLILKVVKLMKPWSESNVDWKISELKNNSIRFSKNDMELMKANVGDLVYLCDKRGWLGGLKVYTCCIWKAS